ncbi:hypothetical protein B932_0207 [Gluconobacter oxydans H24]|nr:hypothetical protein B932_0207 [Gluconobacter oxydans H24]
MSGGREWLNFTEDCLPYVAKSGRFCMEVSADESAGVHILK